MSIVIQFFSLLWRVLRNTLSFLVSLPGMIVTSVASLSASVVAIVDSLYSHSLRLVELILLAKEKVVQFQSFLNELPVYPMIHHIAAFDVLFQVFSFFCTFAFALISTIFIMTVIHIVVIFVPFLIYKLVCKIVQLLSAGFAEPA